MRVIHHRVLLLKHWLADVITGPFALALLPIALLSGYVLSTKTSVLIGSIAFVAVAVLAGCTDRNKRQRIAQAPTVLSENASESFEAALRSAWYRSVLRQHSVVCMIVEFYAQMPSGTCQNPKEISENKSKNMRLVGSLLRRHDQVYALEDNRFGVIVNEAKDWTEEDAMAFGDRFRQDLDTGASLRDRIETSAILVGVSCSSNKTVTGTRDMINAAEQAITSARSSFILGSQNHPKKRTSKDAKSHVPKADLNFALESGMICGWFQPQVCTATGIVTSFETLARWNHPTNGVMEPSSFLPTLRRFDMLPRLQERMLHEALDGFEAWRYLTPNPPSVALNLAQEDFIDPALPDRILWELDRRRISPRYLTIEVLESVVSKSTSDVIARNIQRLSDIGCQIDLDDFGTGHASISSLQHLAIDRLKIDRSFVRGLEASDEQKNMIAAILTMAKQLGLGTVAEGVETQGEKACLIQLGCDHVQGFGIGHPMPIKDTLKWFAGKEASPQQPETPQRHVS